MSKKNLTRAPAHKGMGIFPKSEEEWIALANDMFSWAHLETSFAIEDFPLSRGYSPHKFWKWIKHNGYFADVLEFTRYMVGSRREKAAREKKTDSTIILKTMPLYNYEFRELMMDKIKKHQESQPTTWKIVMQDFDNPGSPERLINEYTVPASKKIIR